MVSGSLTSVWRDYQIAALRALLASLLSPGRTRPPHLSQGLELFRRGSREIGTKVAECCAHAILALEVLIHPRALPLLDLQSMDNNYEVGKKWFPGNVHTNDRAANNTFHIGTSRKASVEPDSYNDDLYADWMRNGEDLDTVAADPGKDTDISNRPTETRKDPSSVKLPSFDTTAVKVSESSTLEEVVPITAAKKSPMDRNEVMVESTSKHSEEILPSKSNVVSLGSKNIVDNASRKEVAEASDAGFAFPLMMNLDKGKELMHESDNESMESIPDIVDVEPDSD